ncbi:DUF4129 domain-containing protein [Promicromonospora thailandica]|uniref:Protein-glutamine gamma-glutamyltransferase-like C-terminal domain-containing protein n=1 Tax=Promicromonospora thailandica TaxID=765201 RepID=A0A9X2GA22_9MICO|nr:DUF4129 domain-containing protein [Promicromonospora thailandica]MCP2265346.1 protein of unknown function (DUF4129) [Promicromonospora thailandica]BFF16880.1 hypothetical protein GCM10025730_04010 [Promicromonospora thailandica]
MRPATRLTATLTLITLAVLGAATATPWTFHPPHLDTPVLEPPTPAQPAVTATPTTPPRPVPDPVTDTTWLAVTAAIVIALLLLAGGTRLVRHLLTIYRERRDTHPDTLRGGTTTDALGDDVDLPEIQDAVTRALAHLDRHTRPRDAVVAAWVALEEAADRAGTHRDPAQTATEFAGTVLAATPAPPTAVTHLRTLYQRARFTDRPIDHRAVTQAREALADIARSLDVRDVEPAADPSDDGRSGA